MKVEPFIHRPLVTVGPQHSVADAARKMNERKVGSAVVLTENGEPAIITERDVIRAVADGADLDSAAVAEYMTSNAVCASSSWDVTLAVRTMIERGFRHLIVVGDGGEVVGVLSIRDLVSPLLAERTTA
ncbi:MAG: CBS domain-containing protein [Actinomycetota bacterium]